MKKTLYRFNWDGKIFPIHTNNPFTHKFKNEINRFETEEDGVNIVNAICCLLDYNNNKKLSSKEILDTVKFCLENTYMCKKIQRGDKDAGGYYEPNDIGLGD